MSKGPVGSARVQAESPGRRAGSRVSTKPKKLSLLHVHLYNEERRRLEFYADFRSYIPSLLFLLVLYSNLQSNSHFVKQTEWIRTTLLEDEFTDPTPGPGQDFAKNSFTVESIDDIWDWGENIVLGSLYPAESEVPALLYDQNLLVGAIQIQQVRGYRNHGSDRNSSTGCDETLVEALGRGDMNCFHRFNEESS